MECRNILFESYGWKWENKPTDSNAWRGYYSNYLEKDSYTIREFPFYLFYGGYTSSGSLGAAGSFGYYWSSTADFSESAYRLLIYLGSIYPSGGLTRYQGFSIRCLAR